jgi:hypothetical protein
MMNDSLTKELTMAVIILGELLMSDFHLLPEMKQNPVGHKFSDHRDLQTLVPNWQIEYNIDYC